MPKPGVLFLLHDLWPPIVRENSGQLQNFYSTAYETSGGERFVGLFARIMWLIIPLMKIVRCQNRLLILFQWGWNYLTLNRIARLITEEDRIILVHRSVAPSAADSSAENEISR